MDIILEVLIEHGLLHPLTTLALGGRKRMTELRENAEKTGDLRILEKVSRWTIILRLTMTNLIVGFFLTGVFWLIAAGGKNGVGMDWFRSYGAILTNGILVMIVFLILGSRLMVRHQLEKDTVVPSEYQIQCMASSKRFNLYMTFLVMQVFVLGMLVLAFLSDYTKKSSVGGFTVVFCIVTVLCVCGAVHESKTLITLAKMDQTGIWHCIPECEPVFYHWDAVNKIRISDDKKVYLFLNPDESRTEDRVMVDLSASPYSAQTIRYMISSTAPGGLL